VPAVLGEEHSLPRALQQREKKWPGTSSCNNIVAIWSGVTFKEWKKDRDESSPNIGKKKKKNYDGINQKTQTTCEGGITEKVAVLEKTFVKRQSDSQNGREVEEGNIINSATDTVQIGGDSKLREKN